MGSKTHVEDSVNERRLRPIYDWLDLGNNKKAIQEADKVLKKQPKLQCARVLKGLALLRLSRPDECKALIDAVVSEGTCDDTTLQALTICYRELQQPENICKVYEAAVQQDPTNDELLSHLFMAHVRVGDYRKQQQIAMQLYKLKTKNPYYFWAVMSIVMQSLSTSDDAKKKISLQVAERMIVKFVSEEKIDAEAEVLTYLYVLEQQDKYEEALNVIKGPLSKKIVHQLSNFIFLKEAEYHCKLKNWTEANNIYKNLIVKEVDNWQHYVNYIDTLVNICDEAQLSNAEDARSMLLESAKFLLSVKCQAMEESTKARGPILGILQLALKLYVKYESLVTEVCGNVCKHLLDYVELYGHKMCCFGDISIFLDVIPKDAIPDFLDKVHSYGKLSEDGIPVDVDNVHRHQVWLQLARYLKPDDKCSLQVHLDFAESLVEFYHRTASYCADMAATDIRPNDMYLIMATHAYLSAISLMVSSVSNGETCDGCETCFTPQAVLVKLLSILEYGINISRANFQLKTLLLKLYNMIGACEPAFCVYEKLDMKHIQLDTMGHLLAFQALDCAHYVTASSIFTSSLKFFTAHYKDTADPVIMSFKFGSLTRIPEFLKFRERLLNSLHYAMVVAEQMLMEITKEVSSHSELLQVVSQQEVDPLNDQTDWDNLSDNRDVFAMNSWDPKIRRLQMDLKQSTFEGDVTMLKTRNVILRLVTAAVKLSSRDKNFKSGSNKENVCVMNGDIGKSFHCIYEEVLDSLQKLLPRIRKFRESGEPHEIFIFGPDKSRIYLYSANKYLNCIWEHGNILLLLHNYVHEQENAGNWTGECFRNAEETLDELLSLHIQHLESFQVTCDSVIVNSNQRYLYSLAYVIQTLGVLVILLGCCKSVLLPLRDNFLKKHKKKKETVPLPDPLKEFNAYMDNLCHYFRKFLSALKDKHTKSAVEVQTNLKNGYSSVQFSSPLSDVSHADVCRAIEKSFVSSVAYMCSSLSCKVKYAESLRL